MYPNVITIQQELSSISIRTVFIHQYIDMYLLEYKLLDCILIIIPFGVEKIFFDQFLLS
jgi:hypothetical protein